MTEDSTDGTERALTRREALQGGGAVAGAALLSKFDVAGSAAAQSTQEPRLQLGEDYVFDDRDGDLVVEHTPSGAQFTYDESEGQWTFGAVATERSSTDSQPASYHIWTDGTTVYAEPQPNQSASNDLSRKTNTDIGPLLDDITENELPPTGTIKRANGKIILKRATGEYPGDLANGTVDGLLVATGLQIEGESNTHFNDTPSTAVPATEGGVWLSSTGNGIVAPDVDSDFVTYPRVADITITGPGSGAGTFGIKGNNSNPLDWTHFERVVVQRFQIPIRVQGDAHVNLWGCVFRNFAGAADLEKRVYSYGSTFSSGIATSTVNLVDSHMFGGGIHGNADTNPLITVDGDSTMRGCRIEKVGGTANTGTGVVVRGIASGLTFDGNEGDFENAVALDGDGVCGPVIDDTDSNNTFLVQNSAGECRWFGPAPNGGNGQVRGRLLIDGFYGLNDGDPSSTGNWNGNARRGIIIEDFSNNNLYTSIGGSGWDQFSFV